MSSLKAEDAIADYSSLNEGQLRTLDQWEAFFTKVRSRAGWWLTGRDIISLVRSRSRVAGHALIVHPETPRVQRPTLPAIPIYPHDPMRNPGAIFHRKSEVQAKGPWENLSGMVNGKPPGGYCNHLTGIIDGRPRQMENRFGASYPVG